jgi:hypothetical protein
MSESLRVRTAVIGLGSLRDSGLLDVVLGSQ